MARLDMLLQFAQANPKDPFPQYGLALEYKNLGRLDEALLAFEQLLRDHPDYTPGYLHAGNALLEAGRRDDARAVYQEGIAACTRKGDAHAKGELEGALAAL